MTPRHHLIEVSQVGPVLLGVGDKWFLCGISNGGRAHALDLKITHEAKDLEGIY